METRGLNTFMPVGRYCADHLIEKYRIPHKNPICLPGSLSFQALPKSTYGEIKLLDQFDSLLRKQVVSGPQIDAALQALSRFSDDLVNGKRPGFFIGDQTGCGKTRVAGLVVLELFHRKLISKALWVSANIELGVDVKKELKTLRRKDLNPRPDFITFKGKSSCDLVKSKLKPPADNSIVYTAYSTLRSGGNGFHNLFLVSDWMGESFNGVIVFDECHVARNDHTKASKVVKWLQNQFPLAKVLYMTATVGTEPQHLSYMDRLGLWGEGCMFASLSDYLGKMDRRGITAMELISVYLQSKGSFVARQLDVSNVVCVQETICLDEGQQAIYDGSCLLWQSVYLYLRSLNQTSLKEDLDFDYKEYWGRHLRYFDALLVTMKATQIKKLREQYPESEYSLVITIQNTGQEAWKRVQVRDKKLHAFSLCASMIREMFLKLNLPVPNNINLGEIDIKLLKGLSPEVQTLVQMYASLVPKLGRNPLDAMISELGGFDKVAEITGRTSRQGASKLVAVKDSDSSSSEDSETDTSDSEIGNVTPGFDVCGSSVDIVREVASFMKGEKKVAILSQKGSTGISLHSDAKCLNQTKRIQICIQPPWTPEYAVQQIGRTNRSGQVHPPKYILLTTDVPGEERFYTSFMERLKKMGAMCQGERRATYNVAGSKHPFSDCSKTATLAAQLLVESLTRDQTHLLILDQFKKVGLLNNHKFEGDVNQLLNRALGMTLAAQREMFNLLVDTYDTLVSGYMARNLFDHGMLGVSDKWVLSISSGKKFGADKNGCELLKIKADRGVSWKMLEIFISSAAKNGKHPKFFARGPDIICSYDPTNLSVNIVDESSTSDSLPNAPLSRTWLVYTPWNCDLPTQYSRRYNGWKALDYRLEYNQCKQLWETKFNAGKVPGYCIHKFRSDDNNCLIRDCIEEARRFYVYVLRGCLLKIWDTVSEVFEPIPNKPLAAMKTIRVSAFKANNEKEKFVGLFVPSELQMALQNALLIHFACTKKDHPSTTSIAVPGRTSRQLSPVASIQEHYNEYKNPKTHSSSSSEASASSFSSSEESNNDTTQKLINSKEFLYDSDSDEEQIVKPSKSFKRPKHEDNHTEDI